MGWMVNATIRSLDPWEGDPLRFVEVAGWASGLVWTGAESLVSTEIRLPDRPVRSESKKNSSLY